MAQSAHEINFNPNPLQKQFIESQAKADLFSSRMGEGKSTALAWSALYHTRHNPGATWYLIRDTWENLQATTMKTFFEWFPPGIMGSFHATKKVFTWAEGVAKGEVGFLGMDDAQDASKLMSRDMAGFGIDEPAPAVGSAGVDEMIFDIAMTRLRQPNMNWYAAKLAENNPDEAHWTFRRFSSPGDEGFRIWQPARPENEAHLPETYYQDLRRLLGHRPDLIRRFVEGEFGFQQIGKSVTPQWSDKIHLATGLIPIPRKELILCWDFGLNPTCLITQQTPMGHWNILEALVGDGIGATELIGDAVKPLLAERYRKMPLRHIGDPMGKQREQSDARNTAVSVIRRELGGPWRDGPVKTQHRVDPLRAVLTRTTAGRGVVQVDRVRAAALWQALRGGWHYHVTRTGITSGEPVKDGHSHPGDAAGYGAAILYPLAAKLGAQSGLILPADNGYWGRPSGPLIGPGPGRIPPAHGAALEDK